MFDPRDPDKEHRDNMKTMGDIGEKVSAAIGLALGKTGVSPIALTFNIYIVLSHGGGASVYINGGEVCNE